MPPRTFTVYQDASPVKKPSTLRPLGRSASAAAVLTTSSSRRSENTISLPEKENMNPLTGETIGNGSASSGKKRKASQSSSVLAPKVLGVASEVSGSVKVKPKRTELKRKASSQTSSGKTKAKKESTKKCGEERKPLSDVGTTSSSSSTTKSGCRAGSRSVSTPTLATIKEEFTTQTRVVEENKSEPSIESIAQALIDSRCYELTVSPLADVSAAYLQSSEVKEEAKLEESMALPEEKFDIASQLRDYFLFDDSRLDSQPSTSSLPSIPTPPFNDDLDAFRFFDFADSSSEDNTPKSVPVTPKKPRHLGRSRSLPATPTKNSIKNSDDAPSEITPLTLSTPERKELHAKFTFTTPKSPLTDVL